MTDAAPRPFWLTALVWIAGTIMILIPLALLLIGVLWPTFFLRSACFLVIPALIALFTLGAILMQPVPDPPPPAEARD